MMNFRNWTDTSTTTQNNDPIIHDVVLDTLPDYEPPKNATIKNGVWDTLKNEMSATFNFVDDVAQGFAEGLKATAKTSKYVPLLIITAGAIYVFTKMKELKWI